MLYKNLKSVETYCEKVAAIESIDAEACQNLTMLVMDAAGYQMVPLDPVNDPEGDEQGCRWEKRNHDIGETLAEILEYYENKVPIKDKQGLIDGIRYGEYESIEQVLYEIKYGAIVM